MPTLEESFNPCFNGISYLTITLGSSKFFWKSSFNPCFNGISYLTARRISRQCVLRVVSILVLMESLILLSLISVHDCSILLFQSLF